MDVPITAKAALLQVLLEGPDIGYRLGLRVYERTGGNFYFGQGSLHPALKKMVKAGLVTSEEVTKEGLSPHQQFKLTKLGKALAEKQRMWILGLLGAVRVQKDEA
jgi:DNA-binding PadR family transcriptional regulator